MKLRSGGSSLLYGLCCLGFVRILMTAGFLLDMPHISHEGWQFHCGGGDQTIYFSMARSFAELAPIKGMYPIGYPVLLAPLVVMFKAVVWQDLVKPVLMVQTLGAIISIYIVGYITSMLTKNTLVSILSAFIWTVAPYLMYVFAGFFDAQWLRNTYVSYLMWFAPLSEPATTFFLLAALYCYLLSLEDKRFVWFAAIAAGFGMCIRVPSAIYCIVFAAGYVLSRRSRDALVFAAVAGVMFIPQLIYNSVYYDGMFSSGYSPEAARRGALYSFAYTEQFFSYLTHKHPVILLSALVAGIAVPLSVWYTFKGLRHQWMVLIGVLFLHILFYTGWWAFIDDFIRFTLPVMPIAIIIGAGFIAVLQKWSASSSISLF